MKHDRTDLHPDIQSTYTLRIVALEGCIQLVCDVNNIIKNSKVKLVEHGSKLLCCLLRHLYSVNKVMPLEKKTSKILLTHAPNESQRMP